MNLHCREKPVRSLSVGKVCEMECPELNCVNIIERVRKRQKCPMEVNRAWRKCRNTEKKKMIWKAAALGKKH